MKKQYMLLIVLVIGMISARAQSSYTTIELKNTMQPALVLELPNTASDVEGTILEKLKQIGYKPDTEGHFFWKKNKIDGFYFFDNVRLPSLSTQELDLYFKVLPKNIEEKNNSTLYLLVSSGNGTFASPVVDSLLWNSTQTFLNSFLEKTTAYNLEQNIIQQENTVKDSQKKFEALQLNEKDLSGKIKKYQDELLTNQTRQKDQQLDIANQQKLLESLHLKRRG
jgi:hypothetical protein